MEYGNGTKVTGVEYADVVELSGYKAINQTLGAVDMYTPDLVASYAHDGLAEFAFQEISSYGAMPRFQTLVDSHVLYKSVFVQERIRSGSCPLRQVKATFVSGDRTQQCANQTLLRSFRFQSKDTGRIRQIQLDGLSRNGEDMVIPTDQAQAIVDTGTALIVTKTPRNTMRTLRAQGLLVELGKVGYGPALG